jgi:beta-lactamase regulating signal transducer with metallopeptidase domain
MTDLFQAILKTSFQGSIVILAVVLLRLVLKKAPKSLFCLLWLLAGLRLVLPFEIQSSLSLQPDYTPQAVVQPGIREDVPDSQGDLLIDSPGYFDSGPVTPAQPPAELENIPTVTYPIDHPERKALTFDQIAAPVWLLGMVLMLAASAISYLRLKKKVREAYLVENGCFECPGLDTAFVLGFLPPRIYLPMGLSDREKQFIYEHENTHIARHDHISKVLGWVVLSIHWFNPLVWLGYSLLCRDIELACDEHVIRNMDLPQRKAYSTALLACGSHTARIAACPVAFGESNPKKRVLNVLNYRKPGFWICLAGIVALVFVALCLMTSPSTEPDLSFLNYENAISSLADQEDVMVIYCRGNSITPRQVEGKLLAEYLDNANWKIRRWEPGDQSSPGSVEFVVDSDYRITIFDRNFARVTYGEEERFYRIPKGDFDAAVALLGITEDLVWNLEVKAANVTPTGLIYEFTQHGPFEGGDRATLQYGSEYVLQTKSGNNWEEVPYLPQEHDIAWTMEAYPIEQGQSYRVPIDWEWLYGELPSGEYRIGKVFSLHRGPGDSDLHTFWAEFTIAPRESSNREREQEAIRLCREAMITLKAADELYLYITNLDDPNAVTNTYMHSGYDWAFQYRRPGWDYKDVTWLSFDDQQYIFSGDQDENGVMTAPYYWKVDENVESHTYQLPYPFDLNWQNIGLRFVEEESNAGDRTITLEFPLYLDVFTFHFDSEGVLLYFDLGDSSGEPEAAKTRCYAGQWPRDASIRDELYHMYKQANGLYPQGEWDYPELFHRQADGAYATAWVNDLFNCFYADPKEFVNQLAAEDEDTVALILTFMDGELNNYAPFLFRYTVNTLPGTHGDILEQMNHICTNDIEHIQQQLEGEAYAKSQLAKCQEALEEYQKGDCWAFTQNHFSSDGESIQVSNASHIWYVCGNNILKQEQISTSGHVNEHWYLYHNSSYHHREMWIADSPEFGESWDKGWISGLEGSTAPMMNPWPLNFDMSTADLTYMESYQDEYGEAITFSVLGDPDLSNGTPQRYTLTFHLDKGGKLLRIQMLYLYGTDQVESIMVLRDLSRQEILSCIEEHYQEALRHQQGICDNPICINEAHDHYGISCTVENCSNPTHHQHNHDHH